MNMSPIKKIVIALAVVTVAISLITANNMASVMLLVASREANAAQQNQVSASVQTPAGNSGATNSGSTSQGSGTVTPSTNTGASTGSTSTGSTSTGSNTGSTGSTGNTSTNNNTQTDKPATDSGSSAGDKATSGKPESKAEIIEYFNKASDKVKTGAKSVTKVHEENYQAEDINLGSLGMFQGAVSGLINDNMGVNEEQSGRTGTTAEDKNAIYPVENETWSSKLTVDDVEEATCTEKNGVYTITITVKEDPLATEYAHGTGHHGKAFNIVMPQTIKDNAGPASSLLSSLKVGYKNGKIVVDVDAKTGNIISAKYDFVWLLNIEMFGGITAHFGIKTDYSIAW